MAATSADRMQATSLVVDTIPYAIAASTIIYLNELVCTNSSGYLVPASDTAGLVFAGIAVGHFDNSGGSAGAVLANVRPPGTAPTDRYQVLDASSATQAWVGDLADFVDDHTVAITGTTNSIVAGRIVMVLSATQVVVDTLTRS